MGAYMHVHGYAIKVKLNVTYFLAGTKNTDSDMSQNKESSETLKYPNI